MDPAVLRAPRRVPHRPAHVPGSLSVWTVWVSLSSGGQHCGEEAAPGTLRTLPTGVGGGTYTETPPTLGSSGAPDVQVGLRAIPQLGAPQPRVPHRTPCAWWSCANSCPGTVQAAPRAGAGTTGGGGVRGETSRTRWEAESERHVPATWLPPRPAGQAAHHALPPVREGDGAGLILDRPTTPPHTHAQPSTVCKHILCPLACHEMFNVPSCPLGRQGN